MARPLNESAPIFPTNSWNSPGKIPFLTTRHQAKRGDVLVYSTSPLTEVVEVTGPINVTVQSVSADEVAWNGDRSYARPNLVASGNRVRVRPVARDGCGQEDRWLSESQYR
jgi:hypothetical protein